ncbi:MAG: serine/threonine-protein phosphatase [Bacteroidetes bacterium]|nr:serine/threonine-protein phosphatase [Bacteroidota bacterium]
MSSSDPHKKNSFSESFEREWNSIRSNIASEWRDLTENMNSSEQWNSLYRKETGELTDYYLTPDQREQLKAMKPHYRVIHKSGWVLKAMFDKLSPERRLLFIAGVLLLLFSLTDDQGNLNVLFGGSFLVVLIMLELKDKLAAHDELAAGRKIQESLMPKRSPAVNGWKLWLYTRSANEVCGDLIDHMTLSDGRFNIIMADVAGKGLHAALITAKLQATVRALAGEIGTLPELIGRINTIVHRDSPSHIFSSLFYTECSEESGTIRFVNAGHFPAIIIRGTTVEETAKGDAALGLARTMQFSEQTAILNSGDRFILYSDGLTEATNDSGEFFGKERFTSVLISVNGSPEEIGTAVLQRVDAFIGNSTPSDDLSLIIIQKI